MECSEIRRHMEAVPGHEAPLDVEGNGTGKGLETHPGLYLDAMLEAVFILRPDSYEIAYVNRQACALLDMDTGALLGQRAEDLPGLFNNVMPGLRELNCAPAPMALESIRVLFASPGGRLIPLEFDLSCLEPEPGAKELMAVARDVSRQVEMETELRAKERLLRTVFDTVPYNIYLKDGEGRYQMINQTFADFHGMSIDQILGHTAADLHRHEDALPLQQADREVLETGERVTLEAHCTRMGERDVWQHHTKVPFLDAQGRPVGVVGIAKDITNQRESDERRVMLEAAVTQTSESIIITDSEGHIRFANPVFEKDTGYRAQDVIGKLPSLLSSGKLERAYFERLWHTIKSGNAWSGVFINKRKDGSLYEEEATISPVRNREGEITHFISVKRDVTDLRNTERVSRTLTGALEQTAEGVAVTNAHGVVNYTNPAFLRLASRPGKEVMEYPLGSVFKGTHDLPPLEQWRQDRAGATPPRQRFSHTILGGETRELEYTLSPVRNGEGEIINHVMLLRDVSREAHLESQLRHAVKMQAIGTLAGGIAHDFNNILTPLLGYVDLLKNRLADSPKAQEDLAVIEKSAMRARDMVSQILLFSRKRGTRFTVLDMGLLTREVTKLLQASLPGNIAINTQINVLQATMKGDPAMLHTVLMNLCVNASQAMPNGGELAISITDQTLKKHHVGGGTHLDGRFVRVEVMDNGVGMPASVQSRIFEPFFTTKEPGEGTGLGLSIVYGIIQQHKGHLEVESTPGEGTAIRVYFPFHEATTVVKDEPNLTSLKGNEKLLFVDDEPDICTMGARILAKWGYQVTPMTDPLEALEHLRENPRAYDMLLLDNNMPDMDGVTLSVEARKIRADIPVILISGAMQRSEKTIDPELNIGAVISKPFSGRELARSIRKVILAHRGNKERAKVFISPLASPQPAAGHTTRPSETGREERLEITQEGDVIRVTVRGNRLISDSEIYRLLALYGEASRENRPVMVYCPPRVLEQLRQADVEQFLVLRGDSARKVI